VNVARLANETVPAFIDCLIAIRRGDRGATLFTVTVNWAELLPPLSSWTVTVTVYGLVATCHVHPIRGSITRLNPNARLPPKHHRSLHESFTYDIIWGDGRDAVSGASIADVNGPDRERRPAARSVAQHLRDDASIR